MHGWNDPQYLLPLLISNLVGLIILWSCRKHPRLGRLLFFFLFAWAGWINWNTAIHKPSDYVDYAQFTFLPFYRTFIEGWFSRNVLAAVGFIASCQLLISLSMLLKGSLFRLGCIGGMLFFAGILPLGVGSGFPFPLIGGLAFYLLFKHQPIHYLWKQHKLDPHVL